MLTLKLLYFAIISLFSRHPVLISSIPDILEIWGADKEEKGMECEKDSFMAFF